MDPHVPLGARGASLQVQVQAPLQVLSLLPSNSTDFWRRRLSLTILFRKLIWDGWREGRRCFADWLSHRSIFSFVILPAQHHLIINPIVPPSPSLPTSRDCSAVGGCLARLRRVLRAPPPDRPPFPACIRQPRTVPSPPSESEDVRHS